MARENREIARQEQGGPGGLMPWRPFAEIARWERDMDRVLGNFFGGRAASLFNDDSWSRLGIREPAVDLYEDKDEIVVKAEMPGMTPDDIEVNITDHVLVLKGEKKKEEEVNERDYYRSERIYGAFVRSVPLPAETDTEKVRAVFKNGVLEVHLPKTEEAKKKEIQISVEGDGEQQTGQGQQASQNQQRSQGQQASQSQQGSQGQQKSQNRQEQGKQGEQSKAEQSKR